MFEMAAMNEFQYAWLLVYLFEACLFVWMFQPIMKLGEKWGWKEHLLIIVLEVIYILAKWKYENYILVNIIVMMLYGSVCLRIFTKIRLVNILWLSAVFVICIEFGRLLIYGTIYLSGNELIYVQHGWTLRIAVSLIKLFMAASCRKLICDYSQYRVYFMDAILTGIAISQLIFMHFQRRVSIANPDTLLFEEETFWVIGTGVLAMLLAMLYRIKAFLKERDLEQIQNEMEEYYLDVQRKSEIDMEVRRIYHDLKHQLSAMEKHQSADPEKEQKMLAEQLKNHVAELERVRESGNVLLDSLLNHKLMEAGEKKVRLELFLETVSYDFIENMDLCSIVGNAIDNALEAACRIEEETQRVVRVKTAQVQGIWVLKVENTYKVKPQIEKGTYLSSKPGPKRNGIGISSIQYCANKYDGNVEIQMDDQMFSIVVTIPVFS